MALGLPTVTKLSLRPMDSLICTSLAPAGISLAMVSAVPRARLGLPSASFQLAKAPLFSTLMR